MFQNNCHAKHLKLFLLKNVTNNEERLGGSMTKEVNLKKIVKNLSKLGVTASVTKSRLEILKVLTPPTQTPQV